MSERDGYQPGVPCWVDTLQPDPQAAMTFYGELMGWEFTEPGAMPGGGEYHVARLRGRDVVGVGSQPTGGAAPAWSMHVAVESADAAAEKAAASGGSVVVEPFDAPPAGRMAVLADPEGAVFGVWEPAERKGAQLVNEPGAWAMNLLNTSDFEAAGRFYGEVFGWEMETFPLGDVEIGMFRLPGYVGGEPQQPVPRDVVAVMIPAQEGQPAQWGVDFWVHDADEAAARAAELGGSVVVAPYPTPISKDAVLADPAGATFMVTTTPAPSPA